MDDVLKILLGAVLALAGTIGAKLWEEWRRANALRAAFAAEIDALLQIIELRGHEKNARGWIEKWKTDPDFRPTLFGQVRDRDPVWAANIDKIGFLGTDAFDVVRFYSLLEAVRVHMRAAADGSIMELPVDRRSAFVQQGLDLWALAKPLGKSLVGRLAPRS